MKHETVVCQAQQSTEIAFWRRILLRDACRFLDGMTLAAATISTAQDAAGRSFLRLYPAAEEIVTNDFEIFMLLLSTVNNIFTSPRLRLVRTCSEIAILIFKHERAIE
jgi:hypothetical protein